MIETFIITWNEEETIHLTLKHYLKFGKVNIYDNYSTDNTVAIAEKMGAFVQSFGKKGVLDDKEYLKIKNNVWKDSKADYVIVCDSDEILQIDESFIERELNKGVTIFKTWGWNVFSNKMPKKNWSEIKTGFHDPNFSKQIIFCPKLQGINYVYGCHVCNPQGDVRYSNTVLPLFHYRNVGGSERLVKRHSQYRKRMSDFNKRLRLGHHYLVEENKKKKEWERLLQNCTEFSQDFI
jgi:glycosyltransferase involved in cell wall biosynthesis